MDVMVDLINFIQQQQFLSIAYVPQTNTAAETSRQRSLKMASRKQQLASMADRLRTSAGSLEKRIAVDDDFIQQVLHIRKSWRVMRDTGIVFDVLYVAIEPSYILFDLNEYQKITCIHKNRWTALRGLELKCTSRLRANLN